LLLVDGQCVYLKHNGHQYMAFALHGVLAAHAQYFMDQQASAAKI
jgi:hypothetical protein